MADQPFTKDDAVIFRQELTELFDAKLQAVNERITGLRNWVVSVIGANLLVAGVTWKVAGVSPSDAATAAAGLVRGLL